MDDTTAPSASSLADLLEVLIVAGVTEAEFHENGQPKRLTLSGSALEPLAGRLEDVEPEDKPSLRKKSLLLLAGRGKR